MTKAVYSICGRIKIDKFCRKAQHKKTVDRYIYLRKTVRGAND